jgi:hypothetical protein
MRIRTLALITAASAFAPQATADIFVFHDVGGSISVTDNGNPIMDGGRISNLVFAGESASFDVSVNPGAVASSAFTNLLEPANAELPQGTVSDRFVDSFSANSSTYHVTLGSYPDLPTIPSGATDLTTIPVQGLPSNPYYEDGTVQLVGTAFFTAPSGRNDTYFIQSDVGLSSVVPEPSTALVAAFGVVAFIAYGWSRHRRKPRRQAAASQSQPTQTPHDEDQAPLHR